MKLFHTRTVGGLLQNHGDILLALNIDVTSWREKEADVLYRTGSQSTWLNACFYLIVQTVHVGRLNEKHDQKFFSLLKILQIDVERCALGHGFDSVPVGRRSRSRRTRTIERLNGYDST